MTTYTQEEQIAQAMAYLKMVKESGKPCGFMEDLQHMGPDGTCWREEFNKVLEEIHYREKTESCKTCMAVSGGKIEGCDDCGLLLWKGGGWVEEEETATDWSDDGEVMCENCGEWGEDCVGENCDSLTGYP